MHRCSRSSLGVFLPIAFAWIGCTNSSTTGLVGSTGGQTGGTQSGGASATGGANSTGGLGGKVLTDGSSSTGGASKTGDAPLLGGTTVTGGSVPTGGSTTAGGSIATTGGSVGTGGIKATGGVIATGGSSRGTDPVDSACVVPSKVEWTGPPARPQLTDAMAAKFTAKCYLSHMAGGTTDHWDPTAGLPAANTLKPNFTVATDGSGTHKTVQEAIDAAKGSDRVYILVKPGTYRGTVCVNGNTPITLYGADEDASKVSIAYDNFHYKPVAGSMTNPCKPPSGTTYGTSDSTTFFVKSNEFQAMNLTIANDTNETAMAPVFDPTNKNPAGTCQAVAMTTHGDRLVFQNVRFIGNQDTLQPGSPDADYSLINRSYYKSCAIEGDVDFIMGRGRAVFEACDIIYKVNRGKKSSTHFAPSTDGKNPFGFLVIKSHIVGDPSIPKPQENALGRAWYDSNANANGQLVIRESILDNHINPVEPWDKGTNEDRLFNADTNRFFEYKNTGAGAAK